jgi:hypothetical protein
MWLLPCSMAGRADQAVHQLCLSLLILGWHLTAVDELHVGLHRRMQSAAQDSLLLPGQPLELFMEGMASLQ